MAAIVNKLKNAVRHPDWTVRFLVDKLPLHKLVDLRWSIIAKLSKKGDPIPIKHLCVDSQTQVDGFWNVHTVAGPQLYSIKTAYQDRRYLKWRFKIYPLFKEFMELWGKHDGQVILDYGCGPANDLVGFLIYTNAKRVIGIDISEKALSLASRRLALHRVDPNRVELIRISDSATTIPLDDESVDYIYCEGVLHHTTNPQDILSEFYRVLKHGSRACIMVYNHSSVFLHLYVAYEQMILQKRFPGMHLYDAFSKSTDGETCPVSRCYRAEEFMSMCKAAGFSVEYVGGYLSDLELNLLEKYRQSALRDNRLSEEHKDFLKSLTFDERGCPKYEGKHAGIGGVYKLYKD